MPRQWIESGLVSHVGGSELHDGREVPLGDGGTFGWLATLDTNRRAVFVASAIGAQLVPTLFRRT